MGGGPSASVRRDEEADGGKAVRRNKPGRHEVPQPRLQLGGCQIALAQKLVEEERATLLEQCVETRRAFADRIAGAAGRVEQPRQVVAAAKRERRETGWR